MAGLFSNKREDEAVSIMPTGNERVDTIIGKGTEINGNIKAEGLIRIDGRFEGGLESSGDVIVGEGGLVKAEVKGRHLTIAGEVNGNIYLSGRLELTSTGKLLGDISVDTIVIRDGGLFKGQCEMRTPNMDA